MQADEGPFPLTAFSVCHRSTNHLSPDHVASALIGQNADQLFFSLCLIQGRISMVSCLTYHPRFGVPRVDVPIADSVAAALAG